MGTIDKGKRKLGPHYMIREGRIINENKWYKIGWKDCEEEWKAENIQLKLELQDLRERIEDLTSWQIKIMSKVD